MSKGKKITLGFFAALFVAMTVLVVWLATLDWNRLKPWLSHKAKEYTGRELLIEGDLDVKLGLRPHLRAEGIRFENASWGSRSHMFEAKLLDVELNLLPLLKKTIDLPSIVLEGSNLLIESNVAGESNLTFQDGKLAKTDDPAEDESSAKKGTFKINLQRTLIRDLTINIKSPATQSEGSTPSPARDISLVIDHVDLSTSIADKIMRFSSKGMLTANTSSKTEPLPVSLEARLEQVEGLDFGTGDKPFYLEANISDLQLTAEGLANSQESKNPKQQGSPSLKGNFQLGAANLTTVLATLGWPLSKDVPHIQITSDFNAENSRIALNNLAAKIGASDLRGNLSFDGSNGKIARVGINMESDLLRFEDIDGFLPQRIASETPAARQDVAARTDQDMPLLSPKEISFAWMDLFNLNLNANLKRIEGSGKLALIDALSLKMTLQNRKIHLDPVLVKVAGGELTAKYDLDGTGTNPSMKLDASLSQVSLSKVTETILADTPIENRRIGRLNPDQLLTGKLDAHVDLTSSGQSLKALAGNLNGRLGMALEDGRISSLAIEAAGFDLTESIGVLFAEQQTTDLSCLLADIKAERGVLSPHVILIGTQDSNIWVNGQVDLNDESIKADIRTAPKDFSIGAIRSPIAIEGTLAKPKIDIKKGPLMARAAAAALLGTLVNPAAAALPFIELGEGQEGACSDYARRIESIEKAADNEGVTH